MTTIIIQTTVFFIVPSLKHNRYLETMKLFLSLLKYFIQYVCVDNTNMTSDSNLLTLSQIVVRECRSILKISNILLC